MKNFILCALSVLCGAWATPASASVQKLGPDLYAYISENDASANSTFLVSERGILVVDTGLNAGEGGKLLQEIRKVSAAPVRWIVNTHYHPDHLLGASAFKAPLYALSSVADKIAAVGDRVASEEHEKVGNDIPDKARRVDHRIEDGEEIVDGVLIRQVAAEQ